MRQAAVIATLLSAAALAAGAAGPADAATPACHLITPAQAHDALGGSVLLRRGEDSTLCNIEYGKPRRDLIMALNPNRPAPRGYTAVKCAYRTRTYTDESYTKVTTTQARLSIPGAIGFEAEIFTKPFTGGAERRPGPLPDPVAPRQDPQLRDDPGVQARDVRAAGAAREGRDEALLGHGPGDGRRDRLSAPVPLRTLPSRWFSPRRILTPAGGSSAGSSCS